MSPIFASSDIAALVANFPPPLPTRYQRSLVRSLSENTLLNPQKVSNQFLRLLGSRNAGDRIKLKDLPSLLQVKSTEWLFDGYHGPLRFSQDRLTIVTSPEFQDIMEDLQLKANHAFVELSSFANQNDIALDCIDDDILDRYTLSRFTGFSSSTSIHVSSRDNIEGIKKSLESWMKPADLEVVDLTQHLSHVPASVLRSSATEVISHIGLRGELENRGDRILFVPAALQEEQKKITYDSIVQEKVHLLMTEGLTILSDEDNAEQLREDVISQYQNKREGLDPNYRTEMRQEGESSELDTMTDLQNIIHPKSVTRTLQQHYRSSQNGDMPGVRTLRNGQSGSSPGHDSSEKYHSDDTGPELIILETTNGMKAVVTHQTLQETLEESQLALTSTVKADRAQGVRTPLASDQVALGLRSKRPGLVSLLLQSQYRETLDAALASAVDELDHELRHRFEQLFQMTVMAPLHLYAAACVGDITLKQNQEAFIGGYFRREAIPQFAETARREGLIRKGPFPGDKARLRDTEFLEETCGPIVPKTLTEVQAAVMKLARKQNIAAPDAEQINMIKRETLKQKGRAIRKMSRGSDVLQNLIWILFARASEGLFMSSGRDTSRMIEQYKLFENFENWQKLVKWRDLLKGENAEPEDLQGMKELAIKVLREMDIPVGVDDAEALTD